MYIQKLSRMKSNSRHIGIKTFLLLLFIFYSASINFFYHTHVINGVTIVHSHLYSGDENGNPTHEHSGSQLQLIHQLSVFHATVSIVLILLLGLTTCHRKLLSIRKESIRIYSFVKEVFRLRPPPVLQQLLLADFIL